MGISVSTVASTRRLTSRARVIAELGVSVDAALCDALIDQVSGAIEVYCHRPFAREVLTETLPGYGDITLQLSRTPVVSVSTVLYESTPLTDYSIESRDEGTLYRRSGWAWTAQSAYGLSGGQRWPRGGSPMPRSE